MKVYDLSYIEGSYQQGDLPLRKRLRDEDVRTLILWWLQGRNPAYIGRKLGNVLGGPVSARMVRRHVLRLATAGHLDARFGLEQPDWQRIAAEERGEPWQEPGLQRYTARPATVLPAGIREPARGRPAGAGKHGTRRGRPPAEHHTPPEDMLRGVAPSVASGGALVVPIYQEGATPPEGWTGPEPAPPAAPGRRQRRTSKQP